MARVLKNLLGNGLIVLAFFLVHNIAFAVEGTCSWHGGVNCNAGSDWDGSAVCNDGWRDSSERYSEQIMCRSSSSGLWGCSNYEEIQQKYGLKEKLAESGVILEKMSSVTSTCFEDVNTLTNSEILSQTRRCTAEHATYQEQYNSLQLEYDRLYTKAGLECAEIAKQERQQLIQSLQPKASCPANLIVSNDNCVCPSGLFYNGSSCVTATPACQSKLGPNSYGDSKQCYCSSGYVYDSTSGSCVQPGTQLTSDERCKKFGFGDWYNTEKQRCDTCSAGMIKDPNASKCIAPTPLPTISAPVQKVVAPTPTKFQKAAVEVVVATNAEAVLTLTPTATATEELQPQPVASPHPKTQSLWQRLKTWLRFWD